jgi:Acyl CoA binding protein
MSSGSSSGSSSEGGDFADGGLLFERAAEHMRQPSVGKALKLTSEQKLVLYAAFKQGTVGDCQDPR